MAHINTFFSMHEYKNEMTGSFNSSELVTLMKTMEVYKNLIQGRLLKIQYFFYLW